MGAQPWGALRYPLCVPRSDAFHRTGLFSWAQDVGYPVVCYAECDVDRLGRPVVELLSWYRRSYEDPASGWGASGHDCLYATADLRRVEWWSWTTGFGSYPEVQRHWDLGNGEAEALADAVARGDAAGACRVVAGVVARDLRIALIRASDLTRLDDAGNPDLAEAATAYGFASRADLGF